MDFKKILFLIIPFIVGFALGKILKVNVTTKGSCPVAQNYLQRLRQQIQSDTSENYL